MRWECGGGQAPLEQGTTSGEDDSVYVLGARALEVKEEIEAGPGPPRGWRKHSLDDRTKRVGTGKKKAKNQKKSVFAPVRHIPINKTSPPTSSSSNATPQMMEMQASRPSRRASLAGAASTLDALRDTIKSTIPRPDNWNWKRYEREDETLFGINDKIS